MTKPRRRRTRKEIADAIRIVGSGIATITLSNGTVSLIDERDVALVSGMPWIAHSEGYAYTYGPDRKMVLLHRLICKSGRMTVDHINGDRLDNRRRNLRPVTQSVNSHNHHKLRAKNKSGHTGVRWRADRKKWSAYIKVDYRVHWLGHFTNKAAAVAARKSAEVRFGVAI